MGVNKNIVPASILVIAILLVIPFVQGTCNPTTDLVCGNTPSSPAGFGAVSVCDTCYTCGIADGFCPEDFYSTISELQGSCGECPDPDCTANIDGYVFNNAGTGVDAARVYAIYNPPGGPTSPEELDKADENGYYESAGVLQSGNAVTLYARYVNPYTGMTYQSDEDEYTVLRGEDHHINFTVELAECNADCTRGTLPYCDASCDGINGCAYSQQLPNYPKSFLIQEANNKHIDTRIELNVREFADRTEYDYFMSCEGSVQTQTRYKVNLGGTADEEIEHLITRSKRVSYRGEPVDVVFVYWDNE